MRGEGRERGGVGAGPARGHIEYRGFDGLLSEVAEIQRLCIESDLYRFLIGELQSLAPYHDDPYRYAVDRDDAKVAWMVFCMSTPRMMRRSRAGRAVHNLWPHFADEVYCIASENPPKYIARMLQRKESEMVLRLASARVLSDRPDITFGTVHDAIICHKEFCPYIQGCIEDAYRKGIEVVPHIRIEPYGIAG